MTYLRYDGTMAGMLCCIFEAYERRADPVHICLAGRSQPDAFAVIVDVDADEARALRVWRGLERKLSVAALAEFYRCFLSELPGIEDTLLSFARYVFASDREVTVDFGHPAVLAVAQTARKVWREKHRMEAFVRFVLLRDNLYYATIEPDHNVLPLIAPHFKSRYADQDWLIYDRRRRYGIYYNRESGRVTEVLLNWQTDQVQGSPDLLDEREPLYQQLWKDYFKSTGIPARINPRLHLQHMPLRYWKYLTEKQL